MKILLALLSSVTMGSPIVAVTTNAIEISKSANDFNVATPTAKDIVDINGSEKPNVFDDSIGHKEKLMVDGKATNSYLYASDNFAVDTNGKSGMKFLTDEGADMTTLSPGGADIDVNQIQIGKKTFKLWSNGNNCNLLWLDADTDGQLIGRDIGQKLGKDSSFSTGSMISSVVYKKDGQKTPTNYIFGAFDSSANITAIRVDGSKAPKITDTRSITNVVTTGIDENKFLNVQTNITPSGYDFTENANAKSLLFKGIWGLTQSGEKDALHNRVFIEWAYTAKTDQKYHNCFGVFDINVDDATGLVGLSLTKDSKVIDQQMDTDTGVNVLTFANIGTDTLVRIYKNENAKYFWISDLLNPNLKNVNFVTEATALKDVLGLQSDEPYIIKIKNTIDNKLILQVNWTSKRTSLFTADVLKGTNGAPTFSNFKLLFNVGIDDSIENTSLEVLVGSFVNSSSISYNFITLIANMHSIVMYRYKNSDQFGQTPQGTNGDINKGPVVENILQTSEENGFVYVTSSIIAFIDNTFKIVGGYSDTSTTSEEIYNVGLFPKVLASDLDALFSVKSLSLSQEAFYNIDAAFPDFARNSEQVRRAFLESIILGKFAYDSSLTDIGDATSGSNKGWKWYEGHNESSDNTENILYEGSLKKVLVDNNINANAVALLDTVSYQVDGQTLSPNNPSQTDNKDLIISASSDDLNRLLRYKTYGINSQSINLTFSGNPDSQNSVIKGKTTIKVQSNNIQNHLDINEINAEVNKKIENQFSDFNINGYSTPSEAVGYILNKINEVIFDDEKKYMNDADIPNMMYNYTINDAINTKLSQDILAQLWDVYNDTKDTSFDIYNDVFQGNRPLLLTKEFSDDIKTNIDKIDGLAKGTIKNESQLRDNLGWGFQSLTDLSELKKNENKDGKVTLDLTNIVLGFEDTTGTMSLIRADSTKANIMEYNGNGKNYEMAKALLNIGADEVDASGKVTKSNHLRVTLPATSLEFLYNGGALGNFDAGATARLDDAADKLYHQVFTMDRNDKTSLFRYLEKIHEKLNIDQSVQFAIDPKDVKNGNYFAPNGDGYFEIVLYDAIYFNTMSNENIDFNIIPTSDYAVKGHFRKVEIYVANGNGTTAKRGKTIFGIVIGSVLGSALLIYAVYVSIRKSFYKRATTRQAAKEVAVSASLQKQARRKVKKEMRKKNKEVKKD